MNWDDNKTKSLDYLTTERGLRDLGSDLCERQHQPSDRVVLELDGHSFRVVKPAIGSICPKEPSMRMRPQRKPLGDGIFRDFYLNCLSRRLG